MAHSRSPWRAALLGLSLALLAPASASAKTHEVEKGDTLSHIARRYGVTVKSLRAKNAIRRGAPIFPGQKLDIPPKSRTAKDERKSAKKSAARKGKGKEDWWVTAKPPQKTQTQKTPKERDGVNPCLTKDPGFGVYSKWDRSVSVGQMIAPERGGITRAGLFDVMIHFHGHEAVRKEWVQVMRGPVLVGIDLGLGSGPYTSSFSSPVVFKKLIQSVEEAVAKRAGRKRARVRKVGLSAWSAGYGAVEQILRSDYGKGLVDSVILLDGLHSGYDGKMVNEKQLEPFLAFARDARRRRRFMFVSHSSIIPPGYASTTETANFLIWKMNGKPRRNRSRRRDPMGLDLIARYTDGNFHVRGYSGNDKMDHCAHIGLMKDVLKVHIRPRWRSPRGFASRKRKKA